LHVAGPGIAPESSGSFGATLFPKGTDYTIIHCLFRIKDAPIIVSEPSPSSDMKRLGC